MLNASGSLEPTTVFNQLRRRQHHFSPSMGLDWSASPRPTKAPTFNKDPPILSYSVSMGRRSYRGISGRRASK